MVAAGAALEGVVKTSYSRNPDYLWSLKFERSAASSPATAISPTNMTALESVTAIASIDYDGALVRPIAWVSKWYECGCDDGVARNPYPDLSGGK
jgi:hypothetical protein